MGVIKKAIKPMFKKNKWNILRGDTVKILAGKDRGQVGKVTRVIRDPRIPRLVVEGLNLVRRSSLSGWSPRTTRLNELQVSNSVSTVE